MQIVTRKVYDVLVVDIGGKLDTNSSGDASDQLVKIVQGDIKQIVLNLDKLDYVSSAGLRVLLSTNKQLQSTSGLLRICNLNEVVKEIFDISGFSSIFSVYGTESEAFSDFRNNS